MRRDSPRAACPQPVHLQLPVYAYRQQILQHVEANTLTVIQGETRCGKSVGVPQIILDDAKSHGRHVCVLVAQPHSNQARSLATHVARLRGSKVGSEVCYVVNPSLHSSDYVHGQLVYVTSSKLFERFLSSSEAWQTMTHLILDDVDSRTIDHDLLFLLVKLILLNNHASPATRNKKIVIISSKLSQCPLEDYFSFLIDKNAFIPTVIKDLREPPKVVYLEDLKKELPTLSPAAVDMVNMLGSFPATGKNIPHVMLDLIGEIVLSQASAGDVFLIFLPGLREMYQLKDILVAKLNSYSKQLNFKMGLLHPQLASWEQEEVLSCAPTQVNIIITTFEGKSIMTSRVKYIIDLGMERFCYFSTKRGINVLAMGWTSKAALKQRAMQGSCNTVFRLFTRQTYESLDEDANAEMRRSCLSLTLLRMKAKMYRFGPIDVLFEQLLDPPTLDNLNQTLKILIGLGAIEGHCLNDFSLTQLGKLAVALEVDIHVARLIMLGLLLCCSVECVIIAAGLMLPMDLFKSPYLQSECAEEFRFLEHKLHYFDGRRFYGNDKYSDMIIFCNVYRHWLNKERWEMQWINETCINRNSLHFLIEKVQLLASGLAAFLEEERLVEAMESEYRKLMELKKGHTNQSHQRSWMFCDDVTTILLSIAGAFNTSIFLGNVPNAVLAQEEFKEISMVGLEPENTFKLSNVPAKTLNNLDKFQEALQVLGPISKVLPLEGSNSALLECSRLSGEELLQRIPRNLPLAAQRAYFLACHKSGAVLNLPSKKKKTTERVCIGRISRDRQIFWSTFLKGRRYGVNLERHSSSLPQCAFGLHAPEEFLIAVTAKFTGAENTKIHVSASTLLPNENFFAVTALLLFRSFQGYLIQTDHAAQKFVYSLQYGPLMFSFSPQYMLVDQLHLIEKIRKKLNRRVLANQLCEGYVLNEVSHLMHWVASQKHCEPHQAPVVGSWQEYPSFKPIDNIEQNLLAWKLNMVSIDSSKDGSSPFDDNEKKYYLQETEENCLLQAFRTVEPDLTKHYVEEWLDGNKDLNQVFYCLLEKIMADPEHKEKACSVLKTMHKRCNELVPKKKKIQVESWYHLLCNPMLLNGDTNGAPHEQKLLLQKKNLLGGLDRVPHYMHDNYVPISIKTVTLTTVQINTLRWKIKNNTNQVRILLPKTQSLTENVVVCGPPSEVEAAMKWIEIVATRPDTRRLWATSINQTYFVPEKSSHQIQCAELGKGENLYGETSFKGFVQFFVQGCDDNLTQSSEDMGLHLETISGVIKSCIAKADKSSKIEIQARLGRVVFACSQGKKKLLPYESNQSLGVLLDALKRKTFFKQYFSDTLSKADYFHIKACLRLFKSISVSHDKRITIFLEDPADLEGSSHATKITIKENNDEPGHFQLLKVQHKERLAVIDLVHLRMGHVKSDIRLSVQGLKDEQIDDRYIDFVSKIQCNGVKLKFPKGPFDVKQLRIKDAEEYVYDGFSVAMNEINQMKGNVCLQKYEVEISPIYLGKSHFSVHEVINNLDIFLSKIVTHAQTIISQLFLSWPSSSYSALALSILRTWKTGKTNTSSLKFLLHQHITKDYQLVDGIVPNQKQEVNVPLQFDIATLVDIIWDVDGLDYDSISLSESLLSFFFRSLQSLEFATCESSIMKAQEIISMQGFPPRIAVAYASLFKCHCRKHRSWTRTIAPHLSLLMLEEPNYMKEICHKTMNLLPINGHDKKHPPNIPLERVLMALGRHWANKRPACFLRIYGLALNQEQNCPYVSNLLDKFVRKLFSRHPSEAPLFVLSSASHYLIGDDIKDSVNSEYCTSLMGLLNLIRDLKVIVTEDCRILALDMLISLEVMNKQMQEIEKMVFEIFEIDVTTFRHCHYRKILSKSLALRAYHLKELERRGLTNEFCQKMDFKSWIPGRRIASSWLIPGLDKKGTALIGSPGIFIPARDPSGLITGAQIKVDRPTTGKYKWLSSNKVFEGGRGPNIDDEWPLFCCTSLFRNFSTLGMCEGGLKAYVLSFLGALPVIGASGATFTKSKKLLERYLAIINPDRIIFFPDAGSQCNDQVIRCYFQTFRLLREFGYFLLIAWWGQVNKSEHEDIDDLLCNRMGNHSIPLLSPSKFWHILHPAVKKKLGDEFPEYSGSSGAFGSESQNNFIDTDGIEVTKVLSAYTEKEGPFYGEYLISIPKQMMKVMPCPPNDLVTPSSVREFTIEVRTLELSHNERVDTCMDWMLQDTLLSNACLGLLCRYDSQGNLCLLELSFHQRCLLIEIPARPVDPHFINKKLQDLLLNADVVKAGANIDRDSLHLYQSLGLTANNCIKLSLPNADRRQKFQLLDMFRAIFKWDWCEKAEVKHSNWMLHPMTLEQIKFAALSAWSCHLIWAQMRESSSGQAKSFCINGVHLQLLDYFQRCMTNINATSQSQMSSELAGATVEIQQGFLILNPANARSKVLNSASVVALRFNNDRDPEEYTTKRVGDKNVLLRKGAEKSQEPDVDVSAIRSVVVDNSNFIDMQRQKVENAIHSLLCNPAACPPHILMALGCIDMGNPDINNNQTCSLPQGIMLNRTQIDALRMMLSNPLCAVIGPPGTGKTRLISGVAKVWEQTTAQGQMLLCAAQQNVAVRHMAEMMVNNNIHGVMLLISHDYYTDWRQEEYKQLDDNIVVSGPSIGGGLKAWTARNKMPTPRILLCTLALIGSSSFYTCVKQCNITYMMIDESSQAAEETLISSLICLPHLQRLSVLGDPLQLPPFGKSVQSVFDLVARNCQVLTLQIQYRMTPDIADFVSREFYRGVLISARRGSAGDHGTSLLWVDVNGSPKTAVGSTSLCNEFEAEAIVKLCKKYILQGTVGEVLSPSTRVPPASMASASTTLSSSATSSTTMLSVLSNSLSSLSLSSSSPLRTPLSVSSSSTSSSSSSKCSNARLVVLTLYEAQRLLISRLLMDNEVQGVSVHNVDSFQGQEAEIIVVSLVVGARMSPFASNRRRACVLLSRAKHMLYIFGSFKALSEGIDNNRGTQEPIIWRNLALECAKRNWVAKAESFLGYDKRVGTESKC
ncbi:hypothetical protein GOP47_0030144 [Adiantum capillus-veneris]|nr:hypothetical protein GOP47_0030144 [Adiantum capillus-veneris]